MNIELNNKKHFTILIGILFGIALILRLESFWGYFEYDEIWSLENFSKLSVWQICTDLSLPNNNPINTLWIKIVTILNLPIRFIRLLSLLAGLCSLFCIGIIAYLFSGKKKEVVIFSIAFFAISAPNIVYSQQARGYSLQEFFLLLYMVGVMTFVHLSKLKWLLISSCFIIIGGVGAVLTLSTSVIYLGLITLGMWIVYQKKPPIKLISILVLGGIATIGYCLYNYNALNEARNWGIEIRTIEKFMIFLYSTFESILCSILLIPAMVAIYFYRKRYLPFVGGILVLFLSAIFTNGGPARTYIPLSILLIIASGEGCVLVLEKIPVKYKHIICLLIGVLVIVDFQYQMKKWKFTDWYPVYQQAIQEPLNVIPVYSANNTYPITYNNKPHCYNDYIKRLLDNSFKRELLMFESSGRINGMMQNGGETFWQIKNKGQSRDYNGVIATRYNLEKITQPPKVDDVIIVIIRPTPKNISNQLQKLLLNSNNEILILNSWFSVPIIRPENTYYYSLFAVKIGNNNNIDWNKFLSFGGGMISGYRIVP